MEYLKNKTVGLAVGAVGVIVAVVGLLADQIGLGADGADGMGGKQVAMLIFGLVIVAAGAAIVFMANNETTGASGAE